ncbi:hypothetical protein SAMN04244570_1396 [Sporosarcina newyorkensis]|uniref:Uncharacterized protein n=1 Tax=Sporosarcina newyorkensis TaxID=759851 RepID=A0A1T4XXF3_9BACL|nr:hypothetical protein SAMN04244570_1396 [Sporosarcina newyorkensis]
MSAGYPALPLPGISAGQEGYERLESVYERGKMKYERTQGFYERGREIYERQQDFTSVLTRQPNKKTATRAVF